VWCFVVFSFCIIQANRKKGCNCNETGRVMAMNLEGLLPKRKPQMQEVARLSGKDK
jgi:hypothetical protein